MIKWRQIDLLTSQQISANKITRAYFGLTKMPHTEDWKKGGGRGQVNREESGLSCRFLSPDLQTSLPAYLPALSSLKPLVIFL